jgi:Gas vesicle synthesis protein GvpL/GvpF
VSGDEGAPALYVYGVVPAGASGLPTSGGVGEPPAALRVVTSDDLGALVSEVPADATPGSRADLEAHQRVLAEAIASTTVLPMRFGVVMDGEEVVRRALLDRHADGLRELLTELDGCVQMTLKAFYAEDQPLREVVDEEPELARLSRQLRDRPEEETRDDKLRLGQLVAGAVTERRARDRERIRAAIEPHVASLVDDEPASDRVAAQLQLLVQRERRGALDAAVEQLGASEAGRLSLRYVGPLAPFSFADMELETEEAAWG